MSYCVVGRARSLCNAGRLISDRDMKLGSAVLTEFFARTRRLLELRTRAGPMNGGGRRGRCFLTFVIIEESASTPPSNRK